MNLLLLIFSIFSKPAVLGFSVVGVGIIGLFHLWQRRVSRESQVRIREELERQIEERRCTEDVLRRTLAMFQLLQNVTAAAGAARSLEEALLNSLDIICSYTGWPVAHTFRPDVSVAGMSLLQASGIWHLECPHDYESFLRSGEQKPLRIGKGLPGRAWSSRRVVWTRFMEDRSSVLFFGRALEVGLTMGFAIPVFRDDELVAVLEFFSPPALDPDETMLNALIGVGEQLGRVAERLLAEDELAELNQKLLELNEEKNQFLGIASHDLKNPLNNIGLTAELLMTGELGQEEVMALAAHISQDTQRTVKLIQKLLDITAIESGQFNLKIGEVSLGETLLQALNKFQPLAEAKGQTVQLDFGGIAVLVLADRDYLQQVVDNLVSNAVKFMPAGPPIRTVTLSMARDGLSGIVEIQDEGPGFSEGDKDRAFGRFSKLSARPTGGESSTGLGLSIARKLIESMHGRVDLESQLGRGATFRITLPLAPEQGR